MKKVQKNTAEVLVGCLEMHGVSRIFGVPGEENLTFLEAIRNSKITFITTHTEQGAVFMAATFGRLTGKIGVALSTLGPGATNLLTGVAYAELGGFPLLVITGQKAIKKSKQGKFQIVDIVSIMKPITKFSATITSGEQIPSMVKEAVHLAQTERPGAVHLELPEDIAIEPCEANPLPSAKNNYKESEVEIILESIKEIENSKHPIIILGGGVNRPARSAEAGWNFSNKTLKEFLNKTKIPFVTTQMGKGVISENNELYIGTTALSGGDYVHQALNHTDIFIVIGHDVIEKPPVVLNSQDNRKIIHINYISSSVSNVYTPTHEIIGDISHSLSVLTDKIKVNPNWDFNYFFKVRDILKKDISQFSKIETFPLRPERIVADLNKILENDGMLALDNGMYKLWIARNLAIREQNRVLLDNTLATMGAGLPSGIALKMLYPKRDVVVVTGDGGFMMSIGELETAVRLKINLVVLVLDDSGFGMIRWKQKDMDLPHFALSFKNPDFIMLAKSFGAFGYKIKKAKELEKILQETLKTKGVHIIACPINYNEANKVLGLVKIKIIK